MIDQHLYHIKYK